MLDGFEAYKERYNYIWSNVNDFDEDDYMLHGVALLSNEPGLRGLFGRLLGYKVEMPPHESIISNPLIEYVDLATTIQLLDMPVADEPKVVKAWSAAAKLLGGDILVNWQEAYEVYKATKSLVEVENSTIGGSGG